MKILVVGAGPAGLTLARALRGRGVAVRHIDAMLAPATTSRALGVQARTLEVLEKFDVAQALLAEAHRIDGLAAHLGPGAPVHLDLVPVHPRFPPVVLAPQTVMERLLTDPANPPERGVAFARMDCRKVVLSHADRGEEVTEADWVIGCDGAHSAVRHAIGADFHGEQYPFQAVLADGECPGLDRGRIHLFPDPKRLLAYFPLPGPAGTAPWRAIALFAPDTPAPPEDASALPFAVRGVAPLTDIGWYSNFRISARQVPRVRLGHVLLCGDAAHIHSPAGGQGMNLSIQDAWSLAAALPQGEAAIDAWAAERHGVAGKVLRATDAGTRVMTSASPMVALARRVVMNLVAAVPPLRRRVTRALSGMDYPAIPD